MHEGQHRVVRSSRELDGADRLRPSVGPLHVDVVEPLRRVRLVCDDNEWGVAIDAEWHGSIDAIEEPRHYIREHGRVVFDTVRFAQTGDWEGRLTVAGTTFELTRDRWWGTRDRSWGIRPVGESEPPGIRAADPFSWFWVYTPIRFEDHTILVMIQERSDGSRVLEEAVRVWAAGSGRPHEWLGRPEHDLTFEPGTRRAAGGTLHLTEPDGSPLTITVEPLLPVHVGIGTGYGYDSDWRHGMWQGPLKVEGVHIDTTAPEGAQRLFGIVDAAARFTYGPHVGYGLFETMVIGPHDRYGFVDLLDGWAERA